MKEHERCYRLNNTYDDTLDRIKSTPEEYAAINTRNPSMNRTDNAPKCSSLWNPILSKIAEILKLFPPELPSPPPRQFFKKYCIVSVNRLDVGCQLNGGE